MDEADVAAGTGVQRPGQRRRAPSRHADHVDRCSRCQTERRNAPSGILLPASWPCACDVSLCTNCVPRVFSGSPDGKACFACRRPVLSLRNWPSVAALARTAEFSDESALLEQDVLYFCDAVKRWLCGAVGVPRDLSAAAEHIEADIGALKDQLTQVLDAEPEWCGGLLAEIAAEEWAAGRASADFAAGSDENRDGSAAEATCGGLFRSGHNHVRHIGARRLQNLKQGLQHLLDDQDFLRGCAWAGDLLVGPLAYGFWMQTLLVGEDSANARALVFFLYKVLAMRYLVWPLSRGREWAADAPSFGGMTVRLFNAANICMAFVQLVGLKMALLRGARCAACVEGETEAQVSENMREDFLEACRPDGDRAARLRIGMRLRQLLSGPLDRVRSFAFWALWFVLWKEVQYVMIRLSATRAAAIAISVIMFATSALITTGVLLLPDSMLYLPRLIAQGNHDYYSPCRAGVRQCGMELVDRLFRELAGNRSAHDEITAAGGAPRSTDRGPEDVDSCFDFAEFSEWLRAHEPEFRRFFHDEIPPGFSRTTGPEEMPLSEFLIVALREAQTAGQIPGWLHVRRETRKLRGCSRVLKEKNVAALERIFGAGGRRTELGNVRDLVDDRELKEFLDALDYDVEDAVAAGRDPDATHRSSESDRRRNLLQNKRRSSGPREVQMLRPG
eukprot:g18070.t1